MRRRWRVTSAVPGGDRHWTSWEFDAAVRDLCRYAPRGLEVESISFESMSFSFDSPSKWKVRLHAPAHPLHPSVVVSFELAQDATRDELAMQFHLACQRWLEWVS
jgi:hypothetical protein